MPMSAARARRPAIRATGMAPIVHHPDVQRNLLTMTALTRIARSISYCCAMATDMARSGGDRAAFWQERANLLTPVAKAFSTDVGVEVASLGVQVHGGMGFIEETGAAALLRDARIAPIYEGTNGIQAIDLVTRKLPQSGGAHVRGYIGELREAVEALRVSNLQGLGGAADKLEQALGDLRRPRSAARHAWRRQDRDRACRRHALPPAFRAGVGRGAAGARRGRVGGGGACRAVPVLRRKLRRRDRRASGKRHRGRRQPRRRGEIPGRLRGE